MTLPTTIPLENGDAVRVSIVLGRVLLVVPRAGAVLTRAEAEHIGDELYRAGAEAAPVSRAQPIKSVDDERVRGG